MDRDIVLKKLLNAGETLIVPDAYDPISAKIIEYTGFHAIQCSGYSYSITKGYKTEDGIDLDKNLELTKEIVEAVSIPVMADGEDGYGDGEYFSDVIRKFINIGVSGINIEDQNHKSKSTSLEIVAESVMLGKIDTMKKIKKELVKNNFIINARTDALLAYPDRKMALKLAIDRANKYLESGADLCFVTYAKTLDEIKLLSREINGPISIAAGQPYNINEFLINDCIKLGIARVSLPTFMIMNSVGFISKQLEIIKKTGEFQEAIKYNHFLLDRSILKEIMNICNN